jgi:hypothetical protein
MSEIAKAGRLELNAYLHGAIHDGTFSRLHNTLRISQADVRWLRCIRTILHHLGQGSWIYREGRRPMWVVETTYRLKAMDLSSDLEKVAYGRGYFDAEGGLPRSFDDRLYIQFAQKDRVDLEEVWRVLRGLGIECGQLHNPSVRADADYWRFYVCAASHERFICRVGSWHPRKRDRLDVRLARVAEGPTSPAHRSPC